MFTAKFSQTSAFFSLLLISSAVVTLTPFFLLFVSSILALSFPLRPFPSFYTLRQSFPRFSHDIRHLPFILFSHLILHETPNE